MINGHRFYARSAHQCDDRRRAHCTSSEIANMCHRTKPCRQHGNFGLNHLPRLWPLNVYTPGHHTHRRKRPAISVPEMRTLRCWRYRGWRVNGAKPHSSADSTSATAGQWNPVDPNGTEGARSAAARIREDFRGSPDDNSSVILHREYATHVISKRNVRSRTYRATPPKTLHAYPEEAHLPCTAFLPGELGDTRRQGLSVPCGQGGACMLATVDVVRWNTRRA